MRVVAALVSVLALAAAAEHRPAAADSRNAAAEVGTIRLSPKDTFLNTNKKNYSSAQTLPVYTWPDNKLANAILMKFDLSALPAGAVVTQATLRLALVATDNKPESTYTVTAHKVIRRNPNIVKATGYSADGALSWTPNTCCYAGTPLAQADITPAYDTTIVNKVKEFKSWNLTTMVQEWMLNPAANFGVLLDGDASKPRDRYREFASMEYATASLRPYLEVTFVAADVAPPTVSITAPAAGEVSGVVGLTAAASDNVAVAGVQFTINGAAFGPEQLLWPYAISWDTATQSDGNYVLTAVARDAFGNSATSAAVNVTVSNGILYYWPQDTYLNLDTGNYSTEPVLRTYTWPDFKVANAILMKFDVSSMPPGTTVQDATLFMTLIESDALAAGTYNVSASKLLGRNPVIAQATGFNANNTSTWTANACCNGGVPLAQGDISAPYTTQAIGQAAGVKTWTLTNMVQEWVADPSTNFGVVFNSDATKPRDHYRTFASMEHANPAARPVLKVHYSLTADATPPAVTAVAASDVTASSAVINWTTDEGSTSQVEYGPSAYGNLSTLSSSLTTSHSVSLSGLSASTTYHFRVLSRDAAGNQTASGDFTFTTLSSPPPPPPPSGGLAATYPGDVGIETDPAVVFVERFDEDTLGDLFNKWSDVLNGSAMSLSNDAPAASAVGKSLTIPWSSGNTGGHLYRRLPQSVTDTLYVRYYVKYPASTGYDHTGIWMGGHNPPIDWPNPQAGTRPSGSDRFSAAAEPNELGRFDHYDYWMGMHQSGDGHYWGNYLLNNPAVQPAADQWMCVEHMVKLNSPVTSANGEHAIWINGTKVSHVGPGFPTGSWNGGIFTQGAGDPFPGMQWRNSTSLDLNWIWLQVYATSGSGHVKYAHLVAAKNYIGCLTADTTPPPPPPASTAVFSSNWDTASGTSQAAVTDGGRWPNYWEFNNGTGVQLLSVVAGGVNGHNALRVQQRGSSFAANLQVDNVLPPSQDFYLRYYMKNDDTSGAGDHIVTADTYNYANLTYMRKSGGPSSWNFVISLYGCGYIYPIGHWGPQQSLSNGQWYRLEYFVDYISATRVQVHPRVYDAAGNLILSDADFRQSDFGGASWSGKSDWTLASYYAAGHSFCVDPGWMNDFGLGNNGQFGAADTGRYWYFSGFEIRTDGWPGPLK